MFVDAVGANKPKGVHAALFGECERIVGSQFAGQNQCTYNGSHALAVGTEVFCSLVYLLVSHRLTLLVDIFKEVFLQFFAVYMFVAGKQIFGCLPPMCLIIYG